MKIIGDTGPLVAWIDRSDIRHGLITRVLVHAARHMLVPDAVVAEVDALLRRRVSHHAARFFLNEFETLAIQRIPWSRLLFDRAVKYDATFSDLGVGLADASVMALAEQERASILTFDFRDFRATRPLRGGFWRLAVDENGNVTL